MTETGRDVVELSANALKVLQRRYLKKGDNGELLETPEQMFRRVARAVAQAERLHNPSAAVDEYEETFYRLMTTLEFLPNSPTLMNAGRELGQLSACFVLPVGDSMESIFEAIKNTALIHKSGGGTGFSFSRVRPKNDVVLSTEGVSSGPLSFMSVFDAATETIKQGGTRRGANMGILRVDHPDILDFITRQARRRPPQQLQHLGGRHRRVHARGRGRRGVPAGQPALRRDGAHAASARKVFNSMVTLAWKNGEPGIVFIDRINERQPHARSSARSRAPTPAASSRCCPTSRATWARSTSSRVCDDGHVDYGRLGRIVKTAVRFLDDVIDVNNYPLPQIAEMTRGNRKIGLGVMGFADLLLQARRALRLRRGRAAGRPGHGVRPRPRRGPRRSSSPTSAACSPTSRAPSSTSKAARACATRPSPPSPRPAPSPSSPAAPAASSRCSRSATCAARCWTTTRCSRSTRTSKRSRGARASTPRRSCKRIADEGSVRHVDDVPATLAQRVRHRPRHHPRVARQAAGGLPERTPTTPCPRRSTSPTTPPPTTSKRSTCWPSARAARASPSTATAAARSRS